MPFEKYVFACHVCNRYMETRYRCTQCADFEMCGKCVLAHNHPHAMVVIPAEEGYAAPRGEVGADLSARDARRLRVRRTVQAFLHAFHCRRDACTVAAGCCDMKHSIEHKRACRIGAAEGCTICKQLVSVCEYHVLHCDAAHCPMPSCVDIRAELLAQYATLRNDEAQFNAMSDELEADILADAGETRVYGKRSHPVRFKRKKEYF